MGRHAAVALLSWYAVVLPWAVCLRDVGSYMDEVFHAPQTQRYCEGHWDEWDPKITTFPGLYLFAAALPGLARRLLPAAALAPEVCSLVRLRAINVLFGVGCLLLLHLLLRRRMSSAKAAAHALMLALYPIHFFYTFLYYTDVGSLFWVLLTHHLATPLRSRATPSPLRIAGAALAGLVAVAFRQTNAVWVMFTFGTSVLADLEASSKWGPRLRGACEGQEPREGLSVAVLVTFAAALLREWRRLLCRFGLLLAPPMFFVAFVVRNGSVVVGDHSNHQAVAHWAQIAYLSAVTASLWGVLGPEAAVSVRSLKAFAAACTGTLSSLVSTMSAVCGVAYLLHRYSLAHPFLLADNRHYTFYIWNRFLGRIPGLKEALAPFYVYAAWLCRRRLSSAQSELWFLIWCVACALTLVPAHLIEPRYWTTAVMLAHVHAAERTWPSLLSVAGAFLAIDLATLAVFRYRPFAWPGGETARFMW